MLSAKRGAVHFFKISFIRHENVVLSHDAR